MATEDRFCEECRERLGLDQLCKPVPEEYVNGATDAILAWSGGHATKRWIISAIMKATKGRANAEHVARIVTERMSK